MTVLIVEDDQGLAELIREQAEEAGFATVCVYSAAEALAWLTENTPLLAILDYTLPDRNAREFLVEMAARGLPRPPFIVSTGQGDERIAVEMMKLGARDYIVKDAVFLELLPAVLKRVAREINSENELKRGEEEREKLQAQLFQAHKMESVGRLAGGVAHDFNNMLGVILGYSELALAKTSPEQPIRPLLEGIREAAERSANLTQQLLAFARKQTVAPKVLDLNGTLAGMLSILQRLIGEDIELIWRPVADATPVHMDPSQLDQILANLCVNARDAITGAGTVTITTDHRSFDDRYCSLNAGYLPGDYVLLAVADNGRGMDQETLSHLFEPFFTTKEVGKGTGLGLATIYGIVKQNNGFIAVESQMGQGTTFTIFLPRYHSQEEIPAVQAAGGRPSPGSETILLVEDEPMVLQMTATMLEQLGYRVIAAASATEALTLVGEHGEQIQLLISDVMMPEMNGRELAARILATQPQIKLLFMSGYSFDQLPPESCGAAGIHYIQKPFTVKELASHVREALADGRESD
jgi:signal transduction histidine kinase